MYGTKDVIIESIKALGLVALFFCLLFAPDIYDALKAKPEPKTGKGTQFQQNNLKTSK